MLFNSLPYAIFLVVVFVLHWLLPNRFRWIMLLIASYCFYMSWNPELVVLIALTTLVSYSSGYLIGRYRHAEGKKAHLPKLFLILALVICFGVLFLYKLDGAEWLQKKTALSADHAAKAGLTEETADE